MSGADVVIVGGGVTGLSAGWWLARSGVKVTVLDKGIVGWEASGRNGGGASHYQSPLFDEEHRLWPQMDELLGYPTEFQPGRIRLAFSDHHMRLYGRAATNAERQGFHSDTLDPAGIYFGTRSGKLFASASEGDSWSLVADGLPPVVSVRAALVGSEAGG